jgi:hypothetical protein
MILIHGIETLATLVNAALSERMRVMPAVVVTGVRQTGHVAALAPESSTPRPRSTISAQGA